MSAANSRTRHRKPSAFSKSLCCLLQAVMHTKISIELRNDDEVRGTLTHVDAKMNLHFVACTLKPVQRRAQVLESLYIAGRSVRYIHFPDEIDLTQALADHIFRLGEARAMYRRRMLPSGATPSASATTSGSSSAAE